MFKHRLLLNAILFMLHMQIYSSMGNNAQQFANQTGGYVAVPAYYQPGCAQERAAFNNIFSAAMTQNNGAQASEAVSEQEFFEDDASASVFSHDNVTQVVPHHAYHPHLHGLSQVYFAPNNNGQQNAHTCLCSQCQANNQGNNQNDNTYQNQSYNYQQPVQQYFVVDYNTQMSAAQRNQNDDQVAADQIVASEVSGNVSLQNSSKTRSASSKLFKLFCSKDTDSKIDHIINTSLDALNAPLLWVDTRGYSIINYLLFIVLQKDHLDLKAFQALLRRGVDCSVIEKNERDFRFDNITILHALALKNPREFLNFVEIFADMVQKVPVHYLNMKRSDGKTAAEIIICNKLLDDDITYYMLKILIEASGFTVDVDYILTHYSGIYNKARTLQYLTNVSNQQRFQAGQLIAGGGAVAGVSNNNDDE